MLKLTTPISIFGTTVLAVLRTCAGPVRLVMAAVLGLLTPIVSTILGALALLLAGTAVLFRYGASQPDFPFWEFLAMGLASAVARAVLNRITRTLLQS